MKPRNTIHIIAGFLVALLSWDLALCDSDIYLEQTTLAMKAKKDFFFSLKFSGDQPLVLDTPPTGSLGADLEYNFFRTYSVGVEFSYRRPFAPEDTNYNGDNDLVFYATDKNLWSNPKQRMSLAYKMSAVLPTSERSQNASMFWGLSEQLIFRKGFGVLTLMYAGDISENFYQYDTVTPTSTSSLASPKYNSPMSFANRLVSIVHLRHDFKWQAGAQLRTSTDFNSDTSSTYSFSTGLAYDASKTISFDCGVRTTVRDTNSTTTPSQGSDFGGGTAGRSSTVGDYVLDPYGTVVYVGTTLRI